MRRTKFTGAIGTELLESVARHVNFLALQDMAQRFEILLALEGKEICKEHGWFEKHECPGCQDLPDCMW